MITWDDIPERFHPVVDLCIETFGEPKEYWAERKVIDLDTTLYWLLDRQREPTTRVGELMHTNDLAFAHLTHDRPTQPDYPLVIARSILLLFLLENKKAPFKEVDRIVSMFDSVRPRIESHNLWVVGFTGSQGWKKRNTKQHRTGRLNRAEKWPVEWVHRGMIMAPVTSSPPHPGDKVFLPLFALAFTLNEDEKLLRWPR